MDAFPSFFNTAFSFVQSTPKNLQKIKTLLEK